MQSKFAPKSPDITSKAHVGPGVGITVISADPGVGDGVDSGVDLHCRLIIPASKIYARPSREVEHPQNE